MTILQIDSSVLGDNSISRQLTAGIVARLRDADPSPAVDYLDLAATPLPHFTPGQGNEAVDQFLAADTVVIGAPMYNFAVPSQLKAWIDSILVAGKTFRYTPEGKVEGLAGPKRVVIAISRGGFYGAGSGQEAAEHVESYLKVVFGFIGLSPEFVVAEGSAIGPEFREKAINDGLAQVAALAA